MAGARECFACAQPEKHSSTKSFAVSHNKTQCSREIATNESRTGEMPKPYKETENFSRTHTKINQINS